MMQAPEIYLFQILGHRMVTLSEFFMLEGKLRFAM